MTDAAILLNQQVADALENAVETTLRDTFQIVIRMKEWTVEKGLLGLDPFIVCTIRMKENADNGMFVLAFSHDTIAKILASYNIQDAENATIIADAAEEIANMIYGMLKTSLNKMGHSFVMDLPQTVTERRELDRRYKDIEKLVLPFLADGHQCRAVLAFVAA